MKGILDGIRVLDLGRHAAVPYGSLILSDMGAEVIRIDRPGGEDDRRFGPLTSTGDSYAFQARLRNRKGISLELRSEKGKELFRQLVARSDIVMENFAVEGKKVMGVDYETLKQANPRIILVSVTAFGLTGPDAHRIGFDPITQAVCGAMATTGFPDGPPVRSGPAWVDYATATHAALGAVLALWHRDKTGVGQLVDVSMLDVAVALVTFMGWVTDTKVLGMEHPRRGNCSRYAWADSLKAKDGWVFISAVKNSIWRRFIKAIGREDLGEDPRFQTDFDRAQNRDSIYQIVQEWVAERNVSEVIKTLGKLQIPCAPINSIADLVEEPQLKAREMLPEVYRDGIGSVPVTGTAIKFSETPGSISRPAPLVGEHNEEILCGLLGLSKDELESLKQENVI